MSRELARVVICFELWHDGIDGGDVGASWRRRVGDSGRMMCCEEVGDVVYEIVKCRWPCRYELLVQCVPPPECNSKIKDQPYSSARQSLTAAACVIFWIEVGLEL